MVRSAVLTRRRLLAAAFALAAAAAALAATGLSGGGPAPAMAASHREAPLISLDAPADITDFFMFRSYEPGKDDKVVLVMDVMSEEPSSGPNYWNFDPGVTYKFNIDNNKDGRAEDIVFEFTFKNEFRGVAKELGLFTPNVAVPSPIDSLEHPGLGFRQKYTVKMVQGGGIYTQTLGSDLIAVPSNIGPRTTPNYEALAQQGMYNLGNGVRVFAGQRDDPFYIDLGAVFDTVNLRSPGTDMLSGFNVHTIALELPASILTVDGKGPAATSQPKLGAYASTERPKVRVIGGADSDKKVQVQRLANPLVNEAIIGTVDKDFWNATEPEDEALFVGYYTNPRLATVLELVFGPDASPLLDLRDVLLTYTPGNYSRLSELLRLDVSVAPVPLASQNPLTVLGGDAAGWPNGRRPMDDVTDVAFRVVGGTNYLTASDDVQANDLPYPETFPFLATPWDGRNRFHENP